MSHFAIAGLQMNLSNGDNLSEIASEIVRTKKRFPWIDMIVLSELASFGSDKKYAQSLPGDAENFYCQLARDNNVWLIPGSHYEQTPTGIFNTASVINNQGQVVARHRKIYPFLPYESDINAGNEFVVFDVPGGRIGVAICYDLWFPEVARTLACEGAEVLIYPTLTGTIDRPMELILAQATAVNNQCYVMTINASGGIGNGQSNAIGPDGQIIYQAGCAAELIPIEIDFEQVRRNRERGLHGLGQVLKSFRDNEVEYTVYKNKECKNKSLSSLSKLEVPGIKEK
ncbi:carbon-nitrogen hydrolase family protein [Thalassotalea crassostreae]|uniref:carbon-nitrogen hydrolase family protein n=1 Tax=Thalassotalea crassostreae TaxID=1763536 RepID=UPI00083929EF|nr:carbon-nitrogen hydrolase family protein [Thalassotalea crassostreae]